MKKLLTTISKIPRQKSGSDILDRKLLLLFFSQHDDDSLQEKKNILETKRWSVKTLVSKKRWSVNIYFTFFF